MKLKIGASILAADFANLSSQIRRIEAAGVDCFHIDIMDGHFVPNITIGPAVLSNIRSITRLPLDVHLMIERPLDWVNRFIDAGADMITLHTETVSHAQCLRCARRLKSRGIRFGISLNPDTPLARIQGLLNTVDFVLVMSVYPGFGGQRFISGVLPKIKALRKVYKGDIAVDGGINASTAKRVVRAGANILDCGTYIFGSPCPKKVIRQLRDL